MAKRGASPAKPPWRLVDCATNSRPSNPEWRDTRGLSAVARRGPLVALNSFGTVRLYDVADPHDVRTLGALELDLGGMAEHYPIGFDRDGHVLLAGPSALHVVDVGDPMAPRLAATHPLAPQLGGGAFVDGVLHWSSRDADGPFATDGARTTAFDPEVGGAPTTFASVGEHLYGFGGRDELRVYRDLALVRTKTCDVAYDARVIAVPALELLVVTSSTKVKIVDVATPANPKLQKTAYTPKQDCHGGGVDGATLYLVDGEYEGPQWLTTVALGRPQSTAGARVPFTDDPELGTGLLLLEPHGRELLVLTTTARFAVLAPPA